MSRYDQILKIIDEVKPSTITEIGTWNGNRAIVMIKRALQWTPSVTYWGYDLFEDATDETDKEEFNVKRHNRCDDVHKHIQDKFGANVKVILIKGNTKETLSKKVSDLVWLDGGHSIDTIRHDYEMVKDSKCVLLDDYYSGSIIDTSKFGCNFIEKEFGGEVLPIKDGVNGGGFVQILRINNEKSTDNWS